MAAEHIPVDVACRVVDVSTSGYYAFRSRPPSARSIRHAWLTDLIVQVHQDSYKTYGAPRVPAELRLGRGVVVGHNAVALPMRRAGLAGVTGRPKWRHAKPDQVAADLVDRDFARLGPNQLWVTDITEHPAHMQVELLDRHRWKTRIELANAVFEYFEVFHNRQRRHSSLGMLTPIQFENASPWHEQSSNAAPRNQGHSSRFVMID
jgi:transposase InsO family protein